MISYDGWNREYIKYESEYKEIFDRFMLQLNYENNEEFEDYFANLVGRKYAVSVASATDALHFALLANNIGNGDEVLVTNFSWISSSACVSMTGATPVFCDIDLESYHMSFESIKRMYSEKTKAIVYVHLFGNMVDTTDIQNFCKEREILFIEDAAQALGSSLNSVAAGTIGDCSVYSFNSNKVVAGINGGGVFLTDDPEKAKLVKMIRRHGKDSDFERIGFNSRMYVLNANIIKFRLERMLDDRRIRQSYAKKYNTAFKDLPVITQTNSDILDHNFHKYTIRFTDKETRDKVKNILHASIHYEIPLSSNSMYEGIDHRTDDFVNSELVSNTILSLPIHAYLNNKEITTIISLVRSQF